MGMSGNENSQSQRIDQESQLLFEQAYRWMLLARILDDKFAGLYRTGKIHGGVFLGRGQEALSAAIGVNLRKGDIFSPMIRDAAGRLALGESILDAVRTYMGSSLGPMRGRDGNVHRGSPKMGILPMISHLGAMVSVVNGMLMARRFKGQTGMVGVASAGDGMTSTGAFHEALNQASIEKLPLVVVIANNQYAYSVPTSRQFACLSLADRAVGYGMKSFIVDGTDLLACLTTLHEAIERARSGQGPQMVVASLLRLCGHGEHDDASYIDPKLKESPLGRDCLEVAENLMLKQNWATDASLAAERSAFFTQVEESVSLVQREPTPDPYSESWQALATQSMSETPSTSNA
jgi:acetoin:2,6-dichlorophenolindophenol oxidoreductase subunit alpha